jgi:mono/diheme cytochrome c family protein
MRGHLFAIGLTTIATGAPAVPALRAHDPITTQVTWTREISRIVQARCVSCHSPGGRAPMSLATYEDARPWAKAIKEEVLTRRMPKWHAARGYGDFSNDPSLSSFEIALVAAWADGGAPKGTDDDKGQGTKDKAEGIREKGLDLTLPCGEGPLPAGSLLAVRPRLRPKTSLGLAVKLPDGRREIVAWVRDFDPDFPATYWLRVPVHLPPHSRLIAELLPDDHPDSAGPGLDASGTPCAVDVTILAPR